LRKRLKKIENVQIIMIINLMGRNPMLELDVNIFWSFSKYVLKMITITSDTWSKYPGLWWLIRHLHNICSVASTKITHPNYDKHSLTHIQTQLDTPLWYARPLIMNLTLSTIVMLMCPRLAHPHPLYPTHFDDARLSYPFLDITV
jgi:hypothetical protein